MLALRGSGDADPDDPATGMCEPCKKKFATLADKERRCDVPGCKHTWTWPIKDQLEAFAAQRQPPKHICASCEAKLASFEDKEIPCSVPGCARHAIITKRQQLLADVAAESEPPAGDGPPPLPDPSPDGPSDPQEPDASTDVAAAPGATKNEKPGRVTIQGPMCQPCHDVGRRLTDRPVHCGINGCKRKWIWKADDQLQAFAAGKPNEPPRRMCEGCRASFGKLIDREVRCRTSGCKKTWTWSRFDQLDACVADKPTPKAPSHMCVSCYDTFQGLKDVERPCRKAGCRRTWTDKRGAQLARLVRGRHGDPYPQYCQECQKELGDLDDREVPCKTDGCNGTWTWTREQQLAAGVRPTPKAHDEAHEGARDGHDHAHKAHDKHDHAAKGHEGHDHAAKAHEGHDHAAKAHEGHDHGPNAHEHAAKAHEGHDHGPNAHGPHDVAAAGEGAGETTGNGVSDQPTTVEAGEATAAAAPIETAPKAPQAAAKKGNNRGRRDRRGRRHRQVQPPERLCQACGEFLKDKKTLEIPCSQCATPIYWPPESQLQTHLGNWAIPGMCGACKRDATEAARLIAKEAIRQQAIDAATAAHPPATTEEVTPPAETEPSPSTAS